MLADPRSLWRRSPLSLRLYVALMAVVGIVEAVWVGARIYRHEAAIHELERVGGEVLRRAGGPAWLRQWPGGGWVAKAFEEVEQVDLWNCPVTDAELEPLKDLTGIRIL